MTTDARADTSEKPLPPGSNGWPLLGETLAFIKDMFGFMRTRAEKHGPVFRSNVLGHPVAFIHGIEATETWLDERFVQREGSFPKNIQELFGGRSLPLLDGPDHKTRKELVMQAFRRDALASYLPRLELAVSRAFGRWSTAGEIGWIEELRRLAVEGICAAMFGLEPGAVLDAVLEDYQVLGRGFTGLPVDLPGTSLHAALGARDRILERWKQQIEAHSDHPSSLGVSRLLSARTPDGKQLAHDDLALELHHVVIAGMIVFAELGAMAVAFAKNAAVREKVAAEIARVAPAGPLTPDRLSKMPFLTHVVNETKRHCPNVPVSFGKARETFEVAGYTVPKGWLVFMAVGENNMNKHIYSNPEVFDPDRFERGEHLKSPHAFQPQGAGGELSHRCAGVDFSSMFMQVFAVQLMRDHEYVLPEQDLSLNMTTVPPEPRSGLRAVITARARQT